MECAAPKGAQILLRMHVNPRLKAGAFHRGELTRMVTQSCKAASRTRRVPPLKGLRSF